MSRTLYTYGWQQPLSYCYQAASNHTYSTNRTLWKQVLSFFHCINVTVVFTLTRGFQTAWSWKVVRIVCTERDRLWRHRQAATWTLGSSLFIPITTLSIRPSIAMICKHTQTRLTGAHNSVFTKDSLEDPKFCAIDYVTVQMYQILQILQLKKRNVLSYLFPDLLIVGSNGSKGLEGGLLQQTTPVHFLWQSILHCRWLPHWQRQHLSTHVTGWFIVTHKYILQTSTANMHNTFFAELHYKNRKKEHMTT